MPTTAKPNAARCISSATALMVFSPGRPTPRATHRDQVHTIGVDGDRDLEVQDLRPGQPIALVLTARVALVLEVPEQAAELGRGTPIRSLLGIGACPRCGPRGRCRPGTAHRRWRMSSSSCGADAQLTYKIHVVISSCRSVTSPPPEQLVVHRQAAHHPDDHDRDEVHNRCAGADSEQPGSPPELEDRGDCAQPDHDGRQVADHPDQGDKDAAERDRQQQEA